MVGTASGESEAASWSSHWMEVEGRTLDEEDRVGQTEGVGAAAGSTAHLEPQAGQGAGTAPLWSPPDRSRRTFVWVVCLTDCAAKCVCARTDMAILSSRDPLSFPLRSQKGQGRLHSRSSWGNRGPEMISPCQRGTFHQIHQLSPKCVSGLGRLYVRAQTRTRC